MMNLTEMVMYHQPVLLKESVEGLVWNPAGTYVDLTFGGGGHSRAILEKLSPEGRLFSFDQDPESAVNSEGLNLTFIAANFRFLKRYLKLHGVAKVHGILGDLGVSSHQFDIPDRGFSTRFEGPLDMRMDTTKTTTAASILNNYSEVQLHQLFGMYGEVKNAKSLAQAIVAERVQNSLQTVGDLKQILSRFAPKGREFKYYAQVFQALRIQVNEELDVLKELLAQCAEVLLPQGRLVMISYHSLEDRLVKNLITKGNLHGEVQQDFFGNIQRLFRPITRKPIVPSPEEIADNNRARSAKLRIAERIES
ncbi:16S rRNA (cytosine(1402)-N(4))-methyltransferase RsmH [Tunicatimonas pelagia]|uniref:16S rRNA (cytosine(1402)-N(4))-methyltransferase RsmH n=1 Tax=Tunicatimonas pelagia TaxID=931531 RepID=UPI002664F3B3|nr:16S rRNA (cytosine(1402)-N(4))-methyltransferase RsmH [Tunicatimonas pelagia]WKN41359.1 16S rRNA (cytosine(1402)-N(4))-methyltransferase RsmH [Tunicatimonas pelagia]